MDNSQAHARFLPALDAGFLLFYAIHRGDTAQVRGLLEGNPPAQSAIRAQSGPTHLGSEWDKPEYRYLDGSPTPLIAALKSPARHQDVFIDVLASTRSVNAADAYGDTPLHVAARIPGAWSQRLLTRGADMTARNAAGQTPLMEAVRFGNLAAVSAMVSVADDQTVALRDPNGLSALDYLERQESTPLRSAMRQAFARANRVAKEHQDSPAAAPAVQPESNRVRRFHRDKDGVIRELPDLPDVGAGLAERIVQSRQTSQTDAVFVPRRPASR